MFGNTISRRVRRGRTPAPFQRPQRIHPAPAVLRDRLRRFVVRRRRLLAGILVSLACGIAVEAYLPPETPTARLVTAAGDLPAGHVLNPGDLRMVSLPAAAGSPGTFSDSAAVAGSRLAVPLRAGTVLADSFLVGPGLLTGSPDGTTAIPLRTADPAAAGLLSPGVLVDVMLAPATGAAGTGFDGAGIDAAGSGGAGFDGAGFDGAGEAVLLAAGVPVLWIADHAPDGGGPWPSAGTKDAGLVVVAARGEDAAALAGASERGNLYLVLSGG